MRILRFVILTLCIYAFAPVAMSQVPFDDEIFRNRVATAVYIFDETEIDREKHNSCSKSSDRFGIVRRSYDKAIEALEKEATFFPANYDFEVMQSVFRSQLASCYLERNIKDSALNHTRDAIIYMQRALNLKHEDRLSQVELLRLHRKVAQIADAIVQPDTAEMALKDAVRIGYILIQREDANYEDYKSLLGAYMKLIDVSDDPNVNAQYAEKVICLAQVAIVSGLVPDEDKEVLFGGAMSLMMSARDAQNLSQRINKTDCNSKAQLKEIHP